MVAVMGWPFAGVGGPRRCRTWFSAVKKPPPASSPPRAASRCRSLWGDGTGDVPGGWSGWFFTSPSSIPGRLGNSVSLCMAERQRSIPPCLPPLGLISCQPAHRIAPDSGQILPGAHPTHATSILGGLLLYSPGKQHLAHSHPPPPPAHGALLLRIKAGPSPLPPQPPTPQLPPGAPMAAHL